jgi:glycosyltransferase involved in cell wall biosynthesis
VIVELWISASTNPSGDVRIVVLTSSYPQFPGDIAGIFVAEHVAILRLAGHQVDVLTWASSGVAEQDGVQRVRYAPDALQTLFYGAGAPENLHAPAKALLVPQAMAAMLRAGLKAARGADLVIGHWLLPGGWIARQIGQRLQIPSLVIGHSGGVHALHRLPKSAGRRLAQIICDGPLTLPSLPLKAKLDRVLGDDSQAQILSMGFHASESPTEKVPRGLFMGRLVPIKAPHVMIEASALSGVHVDVAGDGPLRKQLEDLARDLDAPVTFHGVVGGQRKADLIGRASAFVLPSIRIHDRHEGLPVSLLEATAGGAIPLLGDLPGTESFTPELWQSPTTSNDWAAALLHATTPLPSLREQVKNEAKSRTWDALNERWISTIASAVEGHLGPGFPKWAE